MPSKPKWPWIGFAVSLLVLVLSIQRVNEIEREAMPYFRELYRMDTGSYASQANTEAFLRGFLYGDVFGKAYEESAKGQNLQIILARFEAKFSTAMMWRNIAIFGLILFGIAWFVTRRK